MRSARGWRTTSSETAALLRNAAGIQTHCIYVFVTSSSNYFCEFLTYERNLNCFVFIKSQMKTMGM